MTESAYQNKLIKAIEAKGGKAINGQYTKSGEADLQCGYPHVIAVADGINKDFKVTLLYLAIEVKDKPNYKRVMDCLYEVDGLYHIKPEAKGLKKHEPLQVHKINEVRKKGGLALFAYCIEQVEEYVDGTN